MAFQLIVIGGGNMGSALVEGLVRAQWCPVDELLVVQHTPAKAQALRERVAGLTVVEQLLPEHVGPDTGVVLCVKPYAVEGVAKIAAALGVTRVLSVAAGVATARLEAAFSQPVAIVRSMPNTPVTVGKGVTAIAGGNFCTKADLDWAASIMGAVGMVVRVPEGQLDAVSGLSGAMPAYLYLVVEALIEAGVHQGLTREVSTALVVGTFEGSGDLLAQTGSSPESLRHHVTSPGGVTAAGLRMLEGRSVRAAFLEAVAAAAERSRQLGR